MKNSEFVTAALKAIEKVAEKQVRSETMALQMRIDELEADRQKAELEIISWRKSATMRREAIRRLLRHNVELRQELAALKKVTDLRQAVDELLQRIRR